MFLLKLTRFYVIVALLVVEQLVRSVLHWHRSSGFVLYSGPGLQILVFLVFFFWLNEHFSARILIGAEIFSSGASSLCQINRCTIQNLFLFFTFVHDCQKSFYCLNCCCFFCLQACYGCSIQSAQPQLQLITVQFRTWKRIGSYLFLNGIVYTQIASLTNGVLFHVLLWKCCRF